jgi:hypothetical protein
MMQQDTTLKAFDHASNHRQLEDASVVDREWAQNSQSVNLKRSLVLTGIFRFIHSNQSVEWCYSVQSCALSMEDLIWIIL